MRQGTAQFIYCCGTKFGTRLRNITRSVKKQKGNVLTFNEEEFNGLHKGNKLCKKCKTAYIATVTYEVP